MGRSSKVRSWFPTRPSFNSCPPVPFSTSETSSILSLNSALYQSFSKRPDHGPGHSAANPECSAAYPECSAAGPDLPLSSAPMRLYTAHPQEGIPFAWNISVSSPVYWTGNLCPRQSQAKAASPRATPDTVTVSSRSYPCVLITITFRSPGFSLPVSLP